jgi:hypothetical protein
MPGIKKKHTGGLNDFIGTVFSQKISTMIPEGTNEEYKVRDIPVVDSKYLPVWKRAFAKVKARLLLKNFSDDI